MTTLRRTLALALATGLAVAPTRAAARAAAPADPPDDPGAEEASDPGAQPMVDPDAGHSEMSSPATGDAAAPAAERAEPRDRPPQFGADPPEPAPDITPMPALDDAPGGYWSPADDREREPPDGQRRVLIGSILVPLGTLATVTGAVAAWLSHPPHCVERFGSLGADVRRSQCGGLFALNVVRTSYGALMLVTGAVFLGLGLSDRARHKAWQRRHGGAWRHAPAIEARASGLTIRF